MSTTVRQNFGFLFKKIWILQYLASSSCTLFYMLLTGSCIHWTISYWWKLKTAFNIITTAIKFVESNDAIFNHLSLFFEKKSDHIFVLLMSELFCKDHKRIFITNIRLSSAFHKQDLKDCVFLYFIFVPVIYSCCAKTCLLSKLNVGI